jgi:hypothetical protein
MKKLVFILLALLLVSRAKVQWNQENYKYLEYHEMRGKIYSLAEKNPEIMQVQTSEEMLGIGYFEKCGEDTCRLDIVTLTDNQIP